VTRITDSVNRDGLMRVLLAALGLSALSFAAGVAGDLSVTSHPSSVVVQIPPLPPNAVRAHPLPPLTDSAEAAEVQRPRVRVEAPVHSRHLRRANQRHAMAGKSRTREAYAASKVVSARAAKWDM
jgi:hypothetical protein